jgi:hypothetical protein
LALFPHSRPSTRPAATATTFFNAPPNETPITSFETATRNFSVWKSSAQRVLGDLVGDVRTRKGGALDTEMLLDDFRKDVDLLVLNLDTLD